MSQFKVGSEVKYVNQLLDVDVVELGTIGVIVEIDLHPYDEYDIGVDIGMRDRKDNVDIHWFNRNELELING